MGNTLVHEFITLDGDSYVSGSATLVPEDPGKPAVRHSGAVTSALDQLHKNARGLAEGQLAHDEEVITALPGRAKQAMIVTDRRILMVKPGLLSGAWRGPKAASFPLARITTVNLHTGPGIAALELVIAGDPPHERPDLTTAYQLPNWLPCHSSVGRSALTRELRAYVQSDGRTRSALAELSSPEHR